MRNWTRLFIACWGLQCGVLPLAARAQEAELEAESAVIDTDFAEDNAASDPKSAAAFVRLIKVPLPIRGTVDTQVRRSIEQILSSAEAAEGRPTIVLEFAGPREGTGESSEFGRALDLARYLVSRDTNRARIVAYVPETVRGHAVLVALACEQIIMHPDAQLGDAGASESDIDDTMRRAYSEIAGRRLTIPPAIAMGLLDRQLQVQRLATAQGSRYALDSEVPGIQAEVNVQRIDTVIAAGDVGLLAGDKLRRDFGFVSHLARDRRELAAVLKISVGDLEIDPLLTGSWTAVRVDLHGPMNPVVVEQALRSLEDAFRRDENVNFVCLAIDSPGGSVEDSLRLAFYLSQLDSARVRTVAWVSREARSDAALVALACDKIAVTQDAVLGGGGAGNFSLEQIESATTSLREMLVQKNRGWSLAAAMIDPEMSVHRYQLVDSPVADYFCEEEWKQQRDPQAWQRGAEVSAQGEVLQTNGTLALDYGIAHHVVADFEELQQTYQLEKPPEVLKANWAQELIAALANRRVATILLTIGFFAVMIELYSPGLGIGGFVACVCFLLFFWSNFLHGTAGWLEVLMFLTGMLFIAMEIFVLPGFGIFGLGGGILVLTSLVLASQTFVIPRNAYQMEQLPRSLFMVATAMAGVVVSAVFLHRFLGDSPLVRRLMLQPVEGAAAAELQKRESVVQYDHLLGCRGRTTTPLTPAGKADIDGQRYDVVSDGLLVPRATEVEVISVAGNKIVVRQWNS